MGSGLQVALDAIYALREEEVVSPTPGTGGRAANADADTGARPVPSTRSTPASS